MRLGRVGVALLQGQYEEAVRLIMQPRDGEREETAQARRLYLEQGVLLLMRFKQPFGNRQTAVSVMKSTELFYFLFLQTHTNTAASVSVAPHVQNLVVVPCMEAGSKARLQGRGPLGWREGGGQWQEDRRLTQTHNYHSFDFCCSSCAELHCSPMHGGRE